LILKSGLSIQAFEPNTTRARVKYWLHFNVFHLGTEISATTVCRDIRSIKSMRNILYLDPVASVFPIAVNSQIGEVHLEAKFVRYFSFLKEK